MLEKWADKAAKIFSKKTVEHTKQAIVEDVKKNQTGYVMAGISGLVIAGVVLAVVKGMVGGAPTAPVPMYSVTYNYYISVTPEAVKALA